MQRRAAAVVAAVELGPALQDGLGHVQAAYLHGHAKGRARAGDVGFSLGFHAAGQKSPHDIQVAAGIDRLGEQVVGRLVGRPVIVVECVPSAGNAPVDPGPGFDELLGESALPSDHGQMEGGEAVRLPLGNWRPGFFDGEEESAVAGEYSPAVQGAAMLFGIARVVCRRASLQEGHGDRLGHVARGSDVGQAGAPVGALGRRGRQSRQCAGTQDEAEKGCPRPRTGGSRRF